MFYFINLPGPTSQRPLEDPGHVVRSTGYCTGVAYYIRYMSSCSFSVVKRSRFATPYSTYSPQGKPAYEVIDIVNRSRVLCLFKVLYDKYIFLDVNSIFDLVQVLLCEHLYDIPDNLHYHVICRLDKKGCN